MTSWRAGLLFFVLNLLGLLSLEQVVAFSNDRSDNVSLPHPGLEFLWTFTLLTVSSVSTFPFWAKPNRDDYSFRYWGQDGAGHQQR